MFIGVDPGPTPGIVRIVTGGYEDASWVDSVQIVQCSANALHHVLSGLDPNRVAQVQVERFVARGRATKEQSQTRDQVAQLVQLYASTDHPVAVRNASEVKQWATDFRLDRVGLIAATKGMRHARDAARHAMFAAVRARAIPDPLSRKAVR